MNTITKQDIAERFHLYNVAYFDGKLPTPQFGTFLSWNTYGLCTYNNRRYRNGKIELARNVHWSDESLRATLLHEMIHLYLFKKYPDYGSSRPRYWPHGRLFKQQVRRFRELGIKIPVRGKCATFDYRPLLPQRIKKRPRTLKERIARRCYIWLHIRIL